MHPAAHTTDFDLARRALLRDWRATFDNLHVYALSPARRLLLSAGCPHLVRPDFYLPRSRQFVLVSDRPGRTDAWLIYAAARHLGPRPYTDSAAPEGADDADRPMITCPDFPIVICSRDTVLGHEVPRCSSDPRDLALCQCARCFGWWFLDYSASWRCQCCGHYDGNAGVLRAVDRFAALLVSSNGGDC